MAARYFEFQQGTSDKFWEVSVDGGSLTTRWGRRGTAGQSKTKDLGSPEAAMKAHDKLVAEKLHEGYSEETAGGAAPVSTPAVELTAGASKPAAKPVEAPPAEAPSKESREPPAPPPAFDPAAPRSLDLGPDELRWATWRKIPPRKPEPPPPFDPEEALQRLKRLRFATYGWSPDWSHVPIPFDMTAKEARFWATAMTNLQMDMEPGKLEAMMREKHFGRDFSLTALRLDYDINADRESSVRFITAMLMLPLHHLFPVEELVALAVDGSGVRSWQSGDLRSAVVVDGLRYFVLPRLEEAQKAPLRAVVRPHVAPSNWPKDFYATPSAFHLAALLGMHEELRLVVESWPDNLYAGREGWSDHYHRPQEVIFGLGSAGLVDTHMRRLKLSLKKPQYVIAWLAHTEYSGLDYVAQSVIAETNKDQCEALMTAFVRVHAPEAAAPMLDVHLNSKAPRAAKEWLEAKPAHAVTGLVQLAGGEGHLAGEALDVLRAFCRRGLGDAIRATSAGLPDNAREKIRREVLENRALSAQPFSDRDTPDWLADLKPLPKAKLPQWLQVSDLPPILAGRNRLSDQQATAVLQRLQSAPEDACLQNVRRNADTGSLESFVWKLFQSWLGTGAPSKDKWAFLSLGVLGGDRTALQLAPLVRNWPGESQHARAVLGLEVLRAIGTDTALMALNGIAQKVPFKGLKARANECIEAIARDKGLAKAELEDRIVPDCGLDERGCREFDFGSRKFFFALGPEMKPMVRDEQGALKSDLPNPGTKDDASAAQAAVDAWKLLKKQIREVAKIQAARLEQAMITSRRWRVTDFETLIVRHPLMTHLARLVVWAGTSEKGTQVCAFRVTDERDYADTRDEPVTLSDVAYAGVVHPLALPEEERMAWGQLFSDYKIIPPFPQLGRTVYALQPGEASLDSIARFQGLQFPAPTLVFTLEKLGWTRGTAMDAGCFDEHSKQFPAADVSAVVHYEGTVGMGYIDANEMLKLGDVCFVKGMRSPSGYESGETGIKLGEVDPIVISEVLNDLSAIAAKAK